MVRHANVGDRSRGPGVFLLTTYVPALFFLGMSAGLHRFAGIDFGLISRDPAQEFPHLTPSDYHRMTAFPLIGFQSTVSGLIWFSSFGISLLTLVLARRGGQLRARPTGFLAAMGALTLMLGGLKFLGIVGWCGYLIRQCWLTIIVPQVEARPGPAREAISLS